MPPPIWGHLVAALALAAVVGCSDDDPGAGERRADQARQAAEDAGLPAAVADVLADASAAVDATYRVTYDVEGRRVVVTQRPPDRRVDVIAGDGAVDATISTGGQAFACSDPPGDDGWRCERIADPPTDAGFDPGAVADLTEALAAAVDQYDFSVEDDAVAGEPVRCLVTVLRTGQRADPSLGTHGRLCVADTGALLLVERPAGTLRATGYTTEVADDAFDLPAAPT